jgi:hypothetical protein
MLKGGNHPLQVSGRSCCGVVHVTVFGFLRRTSQLGARFLLFTGLFLGYHLSTTHLQTKLCSLPRARPESQRWERCW